MAREIKDLKGMTFNNLTVLELDFDRPRTSKNRNVYWKCYDKVRKETRSVRQDNIQRKPEYKAWDNLKQKLTNKNNPQYIDVDIDPKWLEFKNFYWDIGRRPIHAKKLVITRLNKTKGFDRSNVAWREK